MKFCITLLVSMFGIFRPLNSANSFSQEEYDYGFYWGGLNSICSAYAINAISEENASMMLNALVEMGNEYIKDSKLNNRFNNLIKTDNGLKKNGCSKLIN